MVCGWVSECVSVYVCICGCWLVKICEARERVGWMCAGVDVGVYICVDADMDM